MEHSPLRRSLVLAAVAAPFVAACAPVADHGRARDAQAALAALEQASNGRLGVVALDTATGERIAHRPRERFPMCGTFAVVVAAALLARAALDPSLMSRRVLYRRYDMVPESPVTKNRVDAGMTTGELCAAALQYGDRSAANLLLDLLGSPRSATAFAHSIGDTAFRLDRWEPELNAATPGDERDTTTPLAMAGTLRRLLVGDALGAAQRAQLKTWMLGNTMGEAGIRAGVPPDWQVADTTGAGDYGTTNGVAVAWPPSRAPLALAIYFTQPGGEARARDDVVAAAARIVAEVFAA